MLPGPRSKRLTCHRQPRVPGEGAGSSNGPEPSRSNLLPGCQLGPTPWQVCRRPGDILLCAIHNNRPSLQCPVTVQEQDGGSAVPDKPVLSNRVAQLAGEGNKEMENIFYSSEAFDPTSQKQIFLALIQTRVDTGLTRYHGERGWCCVPYRAGRQRHGSGLRCNVGAIAERGEAGPGERHSSWTALEEPCTSKRREGAELWAEGRSSIRPISQERYQAPGRAAGRGHRGRATTLRPAR